MTSLTEVTITDANIDELEKLDRAPDGCALLDWLPREQRRAPHIRWVLVLDRTLGEGTDHLSGAAVLRSKYRNDLTEWPRGGRRAMYITERAARAYGSSYDGEIITCAGLVADPLDADYSDARTVG
jgi:hypothetical protein